MTVGQLRKALEGVADDKEVAAVGTTVYIGMMFADFTMEGIDLPNPNGEVRKVIFESSEDKRS